MADDNCDCTGGAPPAGQNNEASGIAAIYVIRGNNLQPEDQSCGCDTAVAEAPKGVASGRDQGSQSRPRSGGYGRAETGQDSRQVVTGPGRYGRVPVEQAGRGSSDVREKGAGPQSAHYGGYDTGQGRHGTVHDGYGGPSARHGGSYAEKGGYAADQRYSGQGHGAHYGGYNQGVQGPQNRGYTSAPEGRHYGGYDSGQVAHSGTGHGVYGPRGEYGPHGGQGTGHGGYGPGHGGQGPGHGGYDPGHGGQGTGHGGYGPGPGHGGYNAGYGGPNAVHGGYNAGNGYGAGQGGVHHGGYAGQGMGHGGSYGGPGAHYGGAAMGHGGGNGASHGGPGAHYGGAAMGHGGVGGGGAGGGYGGATMAGGGYAARGGLGLAGGAPGGAPGGPSGPAMGGGAPGGPGGPGGPGDAGGPAGPSGASGSGGAGNEAIDSHLPGGFTPGRRTRFELYGTGPHGLRPEVREPKKGRPRLTTAQIIKGLVIFFGIMGLLYRYFDVCCFIAIVKSRARSISGHVMCFMCSTISSIGSWLEAGINAVSCSGGKGFSASSAGGGGGGESIPRIIITHRPSPKEHACEEEVKEQTPCDVCHVPGRFKYNDDDDYEDGVFQIPGPFRG